MNMQSQIDADFEAEGQSHDGRRHIEDVIDSVKPKNAASLMLWAIFGFFALIILWAALTQIDRSVHAIGRIVPGSRLQVISNLEGGIVSAILVKAGDTVRAGQPLVRLDQTERAAEFGAGDITAGTLAAKIARLEAEVAGREPRYPVSTNPAVQEQVAIERALHTSQMADLASTTAAANARVAQAERMVSEARAAYESRATQVRSYETQAGLLRPLVERGIEPRMSLVQIENNLAVARSDLIGASATISKAQSQVAEARSALVQQRQEWRARTAGELAQAQGQLSALRRQLPALQDKVDRSVVTAPLSGQINRVLVATVGGSVAPGSPLVELVPAEGSLQIEARLSPKDVGFVRVRQPARINVSAYDSTIYGSMDGEVTTISPDATVDERTGESYYIVRISADAKSLKDAQGKQLPLGPGMTADISLLGDKRSVLSYFLSPFTRLSERALRE